MSRLIVRSPALSPRRPIRAGRAVARDLPAEYSTVPPVPAWLIAVATVLMVVAIAALVVGVLVTS